MDNPNLRETLKIQDDTLAALIHLLMKKGIVSAEEMAEELKRLPPGASSLPVSSRKGGDFVKDTEDFDLNEIEKSFDKALSDWDKKKDKIIKSIIKETRDQHSPQDE